MLRPTGRRILCRPVTTEETIPGGHVVLLPTSRELIANQQAEVVAVGPGERDEEGDWMPMDTRLVAGAWVLHKEFQRVPYRDDLFFLHEDDVVAILGEGA